MVKSIVGFVEVDGNVSKIASEEDVLLLLKKIYQTNTVEKCEKTVYVTSDGASFNNKDQAVSHEKTCNTHDNQINISPKELRKIYDLVIDLPNSPGVYLLHNLINEKKYVGSAVSIKTRLFNFLSGGLHSGEILYRDRLNTKLTDWEITVLETIDMKDVTTLEDRESYYIDLFDSYAPNGYNLRKPRRKTKDTKKIEAYNSETEGISNIYKPKYELLKDNYKIDFTYKDFANLFSEKFKHGYWTNLTLSLINKNSNKNTIGLEDIVFLPRKFRDSRLLDYNEVINSVKLDEAEGTYFFSYVVNKNVIRRSGFDTFEEGVIEFAKSRVNSLKKLSEDYREEIDERAYDMINKINPEDYMRVLFLKKDKKIAEVVTADR